MQKGPGISGVITSKAKLRGELSDGLVRRTRETRIREREKSNLNRPHSHNQSNACGADRLQSQKMEVIGQLTTGIAHDLKNLLTVLSGNLEMLALDKARARPAHDQQILVDEAVRVTDLMAELATNLVAFARREQIDLELADVGELANATGRFLTRILGNGISLEIDAKPSLTAKVNPAQFHTALINLALNARDAMPQGGCVSVRIEGITAGKEQAPEMRLAPGRYVRISVTDSGGGMSQEALEHAFELFYTTKPAGTGLGLAVVREFAANVGGCARITSELGRGTTAELFIPLHEHEATIKSKTPSLAP